MIAQRSRQLLMRGLSVLALVVPVAAFADAPAKPLSDQSARIAQLLSHMSLEHKAAQIIQPDISAITPEDMGKYRFGSYLDGGNSAPGGVITAPPSAWLALGDAMWAASSAPLPDGEVVVPTLWAVDAVHGHNHLGSATIFPHNIGLGAAGDAALVRRIGEATATEIAATGIDWTFAPTLAVAQDVRWGRTYESFGKDPALVSRLGAAMVEGLQGKPGTSSFLDQRHVLATIKHFMGDGGTAGKDEGDTRGDLDQLIATHIPPYVATIAAGGQTLMASFSSINGEKMHGNKALLTGLLRDKLGFDGLVVGDWNAHGQLPGCTNGDCPQALLAGLDIYMAPSDWHALYDSLLREVRAGTIPMARLDEAVGRVLRVKLRYGLFDKPRVAQRELSGQWALLGSPEHRAISREAVRKSLVLLKNDGVLPLRSSARILVAGAAADSVARQAGGWTINWQGGPEFTNADFPGATSIYAGLAAAAHAGGGEAILSPDGSFRDKPDAAVVVFGEKPYAEYVGDVPDLAFRDEEGLSLIRKLRGAGVPTVAVFLSGRPLWMGREIAAADAFVAAWLPGSEGAGVADVLVGDARASAARDFTGKLTFAWPAACAPDSAALFAVGEGGSYAHPLPVRAGDQQCDRLLPDPAGETVLFDRFLRQGVITNITDAVGSRDLPRFTGVSTGGSFQSVAYGVAAQEDARRAIWTKRADLAVTWPVGKQLTLQGAVRLRFMVPAVPAGKVTMTADCADCHVSVDLTPMLTRAAGRGWQTVQIPAACLATKPFNGLHLQSQATVEIDVTTISLMPKAAQSGCEGPF